MLHTCDLGMQHSRAQGGRRDQPRRPALALARELELADNAGMRAASVCSQPGCPNASTHDGRCEEHRRKPWADGASRNIRYGVPSSGVMRKLAASVRRRDRDRCRLCGTHVPRGSGAVDHIVPRSQRGPTIASNLQTLCDACHDHKTAADRQRARGRW